MTAPSMTLERDPRAILEFWQPPCPGSPPLSPAAKLEGWVELIQLAATDLLRREDELVPRLMGANGFSSREARRALRGALAGLTRHSLLALWEDQGLQLLDLGGSRDGNHTLWPRRTVVFAGGAIPQPGLQALVAALMVSGRVLFRPSRQDALLPVEFAATLVRVQAESAASAAASARQLGSVADALLCASWDHRDESLTREIVAGADSIVVFGDQATVDRLAALRRPEAELFAYGPRLSAAVLDLTRPLEDALLDRALEDFAEDVVAFDQRGCLSPQALYVLGLPAHDSGAAMASLGHVASSLARALERCAARGGFTPALPDAVAAEIQSLRAAYAMDPTHRRRVVASPGLPGWTLLLDAADQELKPLAGYQTLRLCPLADWSSLPPVLRPWSGRVQALGIGPDTASLPHAVAAELEALGLSRACPLGRMQAPPLEWTHDGNPFFPVRSQSG